MFVSRGQLSNCYTPLRDLHPSIPSNPSIHPINPINPILSNPSSHCTTLYLSSLSRYFYYLSQAKRKKLVSRNRNNLSLCRSVAFMQELGASPILGTLHVSWKFFAGYGPKKIGFIPPAPHGQRVLYWNCKFFFFAGMDKTVVHGWPSPVYYHPLNCCCCRLNSTLAGHGQEGGCAGSPARCLSICLSVGRVWCCIIIHPSSPRSQHPHSLGS